MAERKILVKGFNSRFEYTGKIFSEREGRSFNTIQSEKTGKKKKMKRNEQSLRDYATLQVYQHMYNRNLKGQGEKERGRKNI